ncbi:uncharacterized protein LOC108735819 [Agrilus planipennis]|uniref:Uncharacterized protein LOC108735819 n=1 Tax=Agrilus planipennis TaxID=224129 RepID=A0A1W4WHS7_AGRPL|nr:uncharacterized protein LOC108735819 [Agrilus planipennis]
MNEINGKYVNVVLSVEEGRGMDFLKNHVQIVTNFNGRILESDYVEPEECPLFNTELVWETEKKDLRKIRSANTPLRVDVRTFDANNRKVRIGYLLLNPRSAIVLTKQSAGTSHFKWHKLLGVPPEFKSSHPELFISLTIRDHVPEVQEQTGSSVSAQVIEEENESSGEEQAEKIAPVFPVKYFEDGFIQVGEDNQITRSFYLSISIKNATNLDLLLPEVLVFTNNREKYYLSFSMFGIVIKTKPFWKELHQSFVLNEKVVISLLSSYEVLRAFFEEHCEVLVRFYCGRDKLGMTKINVQNLFSSKEELKIYTVSENCRFKYPSPHGIVPVGAKGRKPSIEVETTLECRELPSHLLNKIHGCENGTQNLYGFGSGDDVVQDEKVEYTSAQSSPQSPTTIEGANEAQEKSPNPLGSPIHSAGGERCDSAKKTLEIEVLHARQTDKKSASVQELTESREDCITTRSEGSFLENVPGLALLTPVLDSCMVIKDKYQKFSLDIALDKIYWRTPPKTTQFSIKFKHPKANSFYIISPSVSDSSEDTTLEGARCRLYYISTSEEIKKLLYSWPAKIVLIDETDNPVSEEVDVYTVAFLSRDRKECSYQADLKSIKSFDVIAKLFITLYLQEQSLTFSAKDKEGELQPAVLDEKVAVKELEELDKWKEEEKAKFLTELKVLQNKHISVLQEDWIGRKNELEEKLTKNVAKIKVLKKELQAAVTKMKLKDQIVKRQNERIMSTNIQTEIERFSSHDRKDLIQTVFKLEQQNLALKELVDEQQSEIEQIKKTALTKEQTTYLLQDLRGLEEKFEEAQKTKNYFKEQWKNAVREIHELRTEDQRQIKNKLQTHREELSQLSLDNLFKNEAESLDKDVGSLTSPRRRSPEKALSDVSSLGGISTFLGPKTEYYRDPNSFYQNVIAGYTFIHDN